MPPAPTPSAGGGTALSQSPTSKPLLSGAASSPHPHHAHHLANVPDEISPPFWKNLGVVFVEVDGADPNEKCELCAFAKSNPPPPLDKTDAISAHDGRFGVLHDVVSNTCLCSEKSEDEQHFFHVRCLRAFVAKHKNRFRDDPACPICEDMLNPNKPAEDAAKPTLKVAQTDSADELSFAAEDVGLTGGKKRKREKQNYSVFVHIIEATGLKLPDSDKTMNPIAYVAAFGKNVETKKGDTGKTYSCVWDQCFTFQKQLDLDEFHKETLTIKIEDHSKFWFNGLIGFVKVQLQQVNQNNNHEFYRQWTPIVNVAGKKKDHEVGMQGKLHFSICCISEDDLKAEPTLPIHMYDLEVQMWADLDHKKEVKDFNVDEKYLQNKLEQKRAEDQMLTADTWDIIKCRVYRGAEMPKVDRLGGWCDAYVELNYPGLMDKSKFLKTKPQDKRVDPVWDTEFEFPVVAGAPLFYNRVELIVKDSNAIKSDTELGRCQFNISDVLLMGNDNVPLWLNLYKDKDGCAPVFRGRILVEFAIEYNAKTARVGMNPCASCSRTPPSCTYKLEAEMLEGSHLLGDFSDYQVDITWGHTLSGDNEKEKLKSGKVWMTFESLTSKSEQAKLTAAAQSAGLHSLKEQKIIPFLTKQTALAYDMPAARPTEEAKFIERELEDLKLDASRAKFEQEVHSVRYGQVDNDTGITKGWTADAIRIPPPQKSTLWNDNTLRIDSLSMMPDIIVYVSKKGSKGSDRTGGSTCVGYLRIPINSLKRPTQNWEHGEDLTIFPNLFDPPQGKNEGRCLQLKPLKELYEALSGYLLLRLKISICSDSEASSFPTPGPTERLEPVSRQKYRFSCNVYQAKDLASVDPSGLSNPQATIQLNDLILQSKPKQSTCYPLWFESLTGSVELPDNLAYAPDIQVLVNHAKKGTVLKFRDPSIFMGKCEVTAKSAIVPSKITSTATQSSLDDFTDPSWYPLMFEEHQYGDICLSFKLLPEKALSATQLAEKASGPSSLDELVNQWDAWAIEVSALTLRGQIAKRLQLQKVDTQYELECWGDVQQFSQSQADQSGKMTVVIRRPASLVFYSAMNIRCYDNKKELLAVTSIPVDNLLQSCVGWYRLVDLLMRTEEKLTKKVWRQWRRFTLKKRAAKAKSDGEKAVAEKRRQDLKSVGLAEMLSADATNPSASSITTSRFGYLRDSNEIKKDPLNEKKEAVEMIPKGETKSDDVKIDIHDDLGLDGGNGPLKPQDEDSEMKEIAPSGKTALRCAPIKPRMVDASGKEVFDNKSVFQIQCDKVEDKDPGNPWETHWRVNCNYESLPLVRDPFSSFELYTGKDAIHQTFLEKLFARSKHSVGQVRGHFFAYRYGKKAKMDAQSQQQLDPTFEAEKYRQKSLYLVRVYVLRALQLIVKKSRASACDPYVALSIGDGDVEKTAIKEGTLFPNFYECFEFSKVALPVADNAVLTLKAFNDSSTFGDELIGVTDIPLENRLFSKQWNEGRKPIERRALRKSAKGTLAQGFVEVCIEILPMHEAGNRQYDYLLHPPVRVPWELRVVIYNTRNVTLKKIYKDENSMCIVDWCAPPNQSDIKCIAQLCGSGHSSSTDVHLRSIDGEGNFNWRTIHTIALPAPEQYCYLKVQIWNVNWNPDDCLAEAVLPLWGFFEMARRKNAADAAKADNQIFRIPKQWVPLVHPQNSDHGEVEMDIELLPMDMALQPQHKAAEGPHGWEEPENCTEELLTPPKRPETSFPWYRVDKQIMFRVCYCWKKSRCVLLSMFLGALMLIILIAVISHELGN